MRIGIIGHFGGEEKFTDGQTIKTITLYDALKQSSRVDPIDTYYIKRNPIRFLVQLITCFFCSKKIIVLLSSKGRKVLFPVLYVAARYFQKDIYHYAIGGRLAREVSDNLKWKKYVSAFKGNWMESRLLANQLLELGVKNALYIPNFKSLSILTEESIPQKIEKPFRFCTFSRVMRPKGISDAIETICAINAQMGKEVATLDIYGPIVKEYEEELKAALTGSDGSCRYCGIVDPNKSVEILHEYFALLFPTHWKHEGIPGTIIDALASGVPIIARRWQYCDEIITNGETGYVYEWDEPNKLKYYIEYAMEHEEEMLQMKRKCLKKSMEYSEDIVIRQVCQLMGI